MENLYVMLAFSGEKVVGLIVSSVVDQGMTVLDRAGRTLPKLRGPGKLKQGIETNCSFCHILPKNVSHFKFY